MFDATPELLILADSGDAISQDISRFAAPIAAVLIGIVGLRFLFSGSVGAFLGFVLVGIVVYALIRWGQPILSSLGSVFLSWVS